MHTTRDFGRFMYHRHCAGYREFKTVEQVRAHVRKTRRKVGKVELADGSETAQVGAMSALLGSGPDYSVTLREYYFCGKRFKSRRQWLQFCLDILNPTMADLTLLLFQKGNDGEPLFKVV